MLERRKMLDEVNILYNKINELQILLDYARSQINKGEWINGNPICPCCGENKFKDLDADIWSDWQPKYCPNCGAKMKNEEYTKAEEV